MTESQKLISIRDVDDIFDEETATTDNSSITNNIFPLENNLNHVGNVLKDIINYPCGLKEISLAYGKKNICRILKLENVNYKDISFLLEKYGTQQPVINNDELERIINVYSSIYEFNKEIVEIFIDIYKEGRLHKVLSYYLKKANAKNKRHSNTVGVENISFKFNADKFKGLVSDVIVDSINNIFNENGLLQILLYYMGKVNAKQNQNSDVVSLENDSFNFNVETFFDVVLDAINDFNISMIDEYVRIFWELYMLVVFYTICQVTQENEKLFFRNFHEIITLALITGMKLSLPIELNCKYGEVYEELKGFCRTNQKGLSVEDNPAKQQIHFHIQNSDFLTEAYRKEYKYAIHISQNINEHIKTDKHIDVELHIKKGHSDSILVLETTFSGQNPIGRIYSDDTNPETVINFKNCYSYDLTSSNAIIYIFRTMLNYFEDEKRTSHYTEIKTYLQQFKGKHTRNIVPKYLSAILLILYKKPSLEEFTQILNKYFKHTDKTPKAEYRKIYQELQRVLKPKKVRIIDKLRKELWEYVW